MHTEPPERHHNHQELCWTGHYSAKLGQIHRRKNCHYNLGSGRGASQRRASLTPALPPPVPQGMHTTKTQSTVTAYKDRVIVVKLKDHSIAQRYRKHPAAWTKQQVETSIRDNTATKLVKVVTTHQLKSGDIQIFTGTTAEAAQLKQKRCHITDNSSSTCSCLVDCSSNSCAPGGSVYLRQCSCPGFQAGISRSFALGQFLPPSRATGEILSYANP
jgi:hypothetical protein